jgi:hypothetical protein
MGDSLFFVVFVDRDEARRVASLRKANRHEVNHYARAIQKGRDPDADTGRGSTDHASYCQ